MSMKDYLKRYQSGPAAAGDQKKAKKKKKNPKPSAGGVLIVNEDPVWQKPVQIPEDEPSSGTYLRPHLDPEPRICTRFAVNFDGNLAWYVWL